MDREAIKEQAKNKVKRECLRCYWVWLDRGKGKPHQCPHCKSALWDIPKEREQWGT